MLKEITLKMVAELLVAVTILKEVTRVKRLILEKVKSRQVEIGVVSLQLVAQVSLRWQMAM